MISRVLNGPDLAISMGIIKGFKMGHPFKKSSSKKRLLVLLLLLVFGLSAVFFYDQGHSGKLSAATIGRINMHMQNIAKARELRQLQVQADNAEMAPAIDNESAALASLIDRDRKFGVDLVQEAHQEEVLDQTKNDEGMDLSDLPDEKVNIRLLHRKWLNEYDKRLNKQYVNAFLENARDAGYEVLLNDNLDVVQVKRIPQSALGAIEVSKGMAVGEN